jgi:hypothetical protein
MGETMMLSAWALVPLMWIVALLAALLHYFINPIARYRRRPRALEGPRPGAWLPG